MTGRDISPVLRQLNQELVSAVVHHRNKQGVVFDEAVMHDSIGREVLALIFEPSDLAETIVARPEFQLNLRGGLAFTDTGPIIYLLWWVPPVDKTGIPLVVYEHLLNPMDAGTRALLRKVGRQTNLHVVLVATGPRIVALQEFQNEFGLDEIHVWAQAAFETWSGHYDFNDVNAAYEQTFSLNGLLRGAYSDRTHAMGPTVVPANEDLVKLGRTGTS